MPSTTPLPEWEQVLSAAAHLQRILPDAVLAGGTAAALHAGHRLSTDADHVLGDLRGRFDAVLGELESVAGWTTARIARPVFYELVGLSEERAVNTGRELGVWSEGAFFSLGSPDA